MRLSLAALLVLVLATTALSAEKPVSEHPLHLRIELSTMIEPPDLPEVPENPEPEPPENPEEGFEDLELFAVKSLIGWLDESRGTGKGYDVAVLDWDGDGVPERKVEFPSMVFPPTGERMVSKQLRLEHAGLSFEIGFQDLSDLERKPPSQRNILRFDWSVTGEGGEIRFTDGRYRVPESAADAGEGDALRLGPPFWFLPRVEVRGRRAVLDAQLLDENRAKLWSVAGVDGFRKLGITLTRDGEPVLEQKLEYDMEELSGILPLPLTVPSGTYEIIGEIDLSPLFPHEMFVEDIEVEQPPADVLEKTLAALSSADAEARIDAAGALRHFGGDEAKVLPALLRCLKDPDATVMGAAVASINRYAEAFGKHMDVAIEVARGGPGLDPLGRIYALDLLGKLAPKSSEVEQVLSQSATDENEQISGVARRALEFYRMRQEPLPEGD